jgi:hypothetical protein
MNETLGAYSVERSGPGFEIVGPDGDVAVWATTERMAVTVTALLNLAHEAGLIDEE